MHNILFQYEHTNAALSGLIRAYQTVYSITPKLQIVLTNSCHLCYLSSNTQLTPIILPSNIKFECKTRAFWGRRPWIVDSRFWIYKNNLQTELILGGCVWSLQRGHAHFWSVPILVFMLLKQTPELISEDGSASGILGQISFLNTLGNLQDVEEHETQIPELLSL